MLSDGGYKALPKSDSIRLIISRLGEVARQPGNIRKALAAEGVIVSASLVYKIVNEDDVLAYRKHYEATHRDTINKTARAYRAKNHDKFAAIELARRPRRTEAKRERTTNDAGYRRHLAELAKQSRNRRRDALISHMGGDCKRCGFADPRALQVDHVNGGGTIEIDEIGASRVYRQAMEDDGTKYQLLCANCNSIKRHERGEHNWFGSNGKQGAK